LKSLSEFKKLIKEKSIYIYGAGYVAKKVYYAMKKNGYQDRIISFVTTTGSQDNIDGIGIVPVDSISDKSSFVCIAVHESMRWGIEEILSEKGFSNYRWIYPIMWELELGEPIAIDEKVSVLSIINASKSDFRLVSRYAAILQYYGKIDFGYELYLRCMELFSDSITAQKRLDQAICLFRKWDEQGYDSSKNVKVLQDGSIVDGTHRVVFAAYHGINDICCDIYREQNLEGILGQKALMSYMDLDEDAFDQDIIDKIFIVRGMLERNNL